MKNGNEHGLLGPCPHFAVVFLFAEMKDLVLVLVVSICIQIFSNAASFEPCKHTFQ